jgi:hypothetical protein
MFGPEGYGGIRGDSGQVTGLGGAVVGVIARWSIRRSGTRPDGKPQLRFLANFSWRNDALLGMAQKGIFKPRLRVQIKTSKGIDDIDIVQWGEWKMNEDGRLILEDILHFDTQPIQREIK